MRDVNKKFEKVFRDEVSHNIWPDVKNTLINAFFIELTFGRSEHSNLGICDGLIECLSDNHKKDDGMSNA
jgi:hypothetical protein